MRKALIDTDGTRVAEVVAPGREFPVAPPLRWLDCPDTVEPGWSWDGTSFSPPSPPPEPPTKDEAIDGAVAGDPALRGLVRALAARLGVSEATLVQEIKSLA